MDDIIDEIPQLLKLQWKYRAYVGIILCLPVLAMTSPLFTNITRHIEHNMSRLGLYIFACLIVMGITTYLIILVSGRICCACKGTIYIESKGSYKLRQLLSICIIVSLMFACMIFVQWIKGHDIYRTYLFGDISLLIVGISSYSFLDLRWRRGASELEVNRIRLFHERSEEYVPEGMIEIRPGSYWVR